VIWGAVIVAAGRGTRFGGPKQLIDLAGKPMLAWSIETFASMPEIVELVVVTEPEFLEATQAVCARSAGGVLPWRVVAGGATRQESVRLGIAALPLPCGGVLVHDGARPLVEAHDIRAGMHPVRPGIATLLATPCIDTIKVANEDRKVVRTMDRATLWAAQTPQFATYRDMERAHGEAVRGEWPAATDDAALLERAGADVIVVESSIDNIKVTHPGDLVRAEAIALAREPRPLEEDDVFLIECFVEDRAVDAVLTELESRSARIDGVDRDLPNAVAIRAYAGSDALRGFGLRLHALAGEDAIFTTHLSHVVPRL
jgi:2-C-methyl-D-erythritol 4-phosphate cytidylyltransferase